MSKQIVGKKEWHKNVCVSVFNFLMVYGEREFVGKWEIKAGIYE